MNKSRISKWSIYGWCVIVFTFIGGVFLQSHMHHRIPIHWNITGNVDGYAQPWVAVYIMPVVHAIIYGFLLILPKIDPKRDNYLTFDHTYRLFTFVFVLFFSALIWMVDLQGIGMQFPLVMLLQLMLGILFVILGNWLGRVRHNYFIGIRTPWTLANETVWKKTHRFVGKLYVISGVIIGFAAALPHTVGFVVMIALILLSSSMGIVYSFMIYRRI
ncbi:SdpI family protein [Fodinisporobacter ferrooxydans]|uniref:SdpI family protein n=1 Tax=Fodinisporobacter ferrooxydans TaxID=2901836 RepID=A0ABY4CRQ9_9BACL|nr:SdpI family protein [Alicyclobacillaceae bacterium MYW30-H2]